MSEVSFMEKLLDGVEVEWKALGLVIESLKTGLNPRKNFKLNTPDAEGYYVTVREIQNGSIVFLDKTDRVNNKALGLINNRSNLEEGDVLFSGTGTVGRIAVIETRPENWNIKEGVYVIKPVRKVLDSKYLSHLLNSHDIEKEYRKKIVGLPVVSLPMSELKKLQIPIPCPNNPKKSLAIQAEIVRILDTFTELTTELTTELNARKKQYNYYRDQLLSFEEGEVEWKTLGEVYEFQYGKGNTIPTVGGQYPVYGSNGIVGTHNEFNSEDSPVIGHIGAYAGIVNWGSGKHYVTYNGVICRIKATFVTSKYAYYQLLNQDFISMAHSASQPFVSYSMLNKVKIPIPPLAEQERIVAILDKFDTLTNSISEGLPREIELRQKQYEYYRDLLLSFPRPDSEVAA